MKKTSRFALIVILLLFISIPASAEAFKVEQFKDVNKDHQYYEEIHKMAALDILKGQGGYFKPENNLTRAQLAVILNRLDIDALENKEVEILDIEEDQWWYEDVKAVVNKGLMNLRGGKFNPNIPVREKDLSSLIERDTNQLVTRGQIAYILTNYLESIDEEIQELKVEVIDLKKEATKDDIKTLLEIDYLAGEVTIEELASYLMEGKELSYGNYEYYRSEIGVSNRNVLKAYSEGLLEEDMLEGSVSLGDLYRIRENLQYPKYPARPEYKLIKQVPILMYHQIAPLPEGGASSLYIHPDTFMAQLDALKENGYNTISMEQLYNHWNKGWPIPDKPIILTFDDGYMAHYTIGPEELTRRGMTGTFYYITNLIGDRGQILRKIYLDGVEVASHTIHHVKSTELDLESLTYEYKGSKEVLESYIGDEVRHFSFPHGKYNEDAISLLEQIGYKTATTTKYGIAHMDQANYTLQRIWVDYKDSPEKLLNKIKF